MRSRAGLDQHVPEGLFVYIEVSKIHIVIAIISPRHDLYPGWCTERLGKAMRKTQSVLCKLVQFGCVVRKGSVATQTFISHIIRHYQDDVGSFRLIPAGVVTTHQSADKQQNNGMYYPDFFHNLFKFFFS